METEQALGRFGVAEPAGPVSMASAMEQYLDYCRSELKSQTVRMYRITLSGLARWLGAGAHLPMADLTADRIEQFYRARRRQRNRSGEPISDVTVAIDARHLKTFCRWCMRQGWITQQPVTRMPHVQRDARHVLFLTVEQLAAILREEPRPAMRDLYRFLAITGARVGESVALIWAKVGRELIRLDPASTKRGVRGEIELSASLRALLAEMRSRCDNGQPNPDARLWPFNARWASRCFKAAVRRAGLPEHYHIHCLRHSAAAAMLAAGVDIYTVSRILRHSSVSLTERAYGHLVTGHRAREMERSDMAKLAGGGLDRSKNEVK